MDSTGLNILDIYKDFEDNISSMNFVWSTSIIIIIAVWITVSIINSNIQHVTAGDTLWFSSLLSGKVIQTFFEVKYPFNNKRRLKFTRFIWIISTLGIVCTWGYLSIMSKELLHFTTGDAAWFTALFASKVGQTYVERIK